jgi:hypothetical protein
VETENVLAAASACYILATQRALRRYWIKPSLRARVKCSGSSILEYLNKGYVDLLSGGAGGLEGVLRIV